MLNVHSVLIAGIFMVAASSAHAQSTPVGQASAKASEASVASLESVAALTEAGFKVSVGVVAVPLAVVGHSAEILGAGAASAGEEGLRFANEPLAVTNRVAVREPQPLPELDE